MKEKYNLVVVGAGIFGIEIALQAIENGLDVKIIDAKEDILMGASMNNQNRLHLGFHYPRDIDTALQSIRGFSSFKLKYKECIQDNFLNTYFIASDNTKTTFDDYIKFCDNLNLQYRIISHNDLPFILDNVRGGISCNEVVYDCEILRNLVRKKIIKNKISFSFKSRVEKINKVNGIFNLKTSSNEEFYSDIVVNATYGSSNYLSAQLGIDIPDRLYEYTAVPIIDLDIPKIGLTIMDGPFFTVLPYGKTNKFLLYHVDLSVIKSEINSSLNLSWLNKATSPFAMINKKNYFTLMIKECSKFMPILNKSKLINYLEGPRMVLPKIDYSDARPSLISENDDYFDVFSGKIDHSIWVAQEIINKIQFKFKI